MMGALASAFTGTTLSRVTPRPTTRNVTSVSFWEGSSS